MSKNIEKVEAVPATTNESSNDNATEETKDMEVLRESENLSVQAEMEEENTTSHSNRIVSNSKNDELSTAAISERSDTLKANDNKAAMEETSDENKVNMEVVIEPEKLNAEGEMEKEEENENEEEEEDTTHPNLIVSKSKNELQSPLVVERSDTLKVIDNKALKENISRQTMELIEAMDSENASSNSSNKVQSKEDKELPSVTTSLGLLSQYNSDSDKDSNIDDADCEDNDVMEVAIDGAKTYRNKIIEIKSESESDSTSSDDSELEYMKKIRKEIRKTIDLEEDDNDDDDNDNDNYGCVGDDARKKKKKQNSNMRVKGELLLEDLPPIQDLHITVNEEECEKLGRVHSIVDQLVLVSVVPDSLLLDLDTVLFLDKGKKVLGEIFDVLGQVADPMYCVRFNSNKEIEEKDIKIGDTVYVAPRTQYTQIVVLSSLMKLRGSDASWENDVEPPPHHVDYSDDEQEREARSRHRNQDRPNDHHDPKKRARGNDTINVDVDRPSSSQSRNPQRNERYNRDHSGSARSSNQSQWNRAQSPNVSGNSGSWHSNYRQPYNPYPNAPMMLQAQSNVMIPNYPMGYGPGPFGPQRMTTPPPPHHLPMYVLNPLAVNCPPMVKNSPQYYKLKENNRDKTPSPPPPPPGLD